MITRKELLKSKEFWLVKIQAALYEQVEKYLESNCISKTDFASKLGVSKGYVSQILNGDFDHKMSKFIELSLAIDKVPIIRFEDIEQCFVLDSIGELNNLEKNPFHIDLSFSFSKSMKIEKSLERKASYFAKNPSNTKIQPKQLKHINQKSHSLA